MATALTELINKYRHNRKMLLFIVYIALFLDNMLLTTVVPIVPEYLLRLSHPNFTDLLLYDKISVSEQSRVKRATFMEKREENENEQEPFIWDDAWEIPMDLHAATEWRKGPLNPFRKSKNLKKKPSSKGKTSRTTTIRMKMTATETSITNKNSKMDQRVIPNAAEEMKRHNTLTEENVYVGLMFGSKALVQLLTNPWIGPLTNKIGYTVPMFTGFCVMFLSTLMFTFGTSFAVLWFARALQGVGSACTSTSGMGMLAQAYPNDEERGSAMGIALGGLALGLLIGPPYGGVLYQWSGKELPFLLLALLALFDGSLQFLVLQPRIDRCEPEGTGLKELATDPYIIVAAGSITIGNLGIAMLEPSLPLWMMESWQASSFERGIAFLPASMSYLIGTNIFGPLAHKIGRWLSSFLGLIIIGVCLIIIPTAEGVEGLIVPNFLMGFSIGMIDASMFPLMGHLVDIRHVGVYGSIYAIADAAFCFAFALGPFFSGPLVRSVGFASMLRIIAAINFLYAPLMLFLRNPAEINKINNIIKEPAETKKFTNDMYEQIEEYERKDGLIDYIRLPSGMHLNVIVYNKTRNFAGQKIEVKISPMDTIKTLKEKIMEKTDIPIGIQDITFGVQSLDDASTIKYHRIEDGYTVYSMPTYVEIPHQPSL